MHCINISSPEFVSLLEETKYTPTVLKAKIATWQSKNGLDKYPTKDNLLTYSDSLEIKKPSKEIIEGYLERAGVDTNALNDTMIDNNLSESRVLDMFQNFIKTIEGKQDYSTLPIEAGDLFVHMLGRDNLYVSKLYDLIQNTTTYKDFLANDALKYNEDIDKIKVEAVGILVGKYALKKEARNENDNETLHNKTVAIANNIVKEVNRLFTESQDKTLMNDIHETFKTHPDFNKASPTIRTQEDKVSDYNALKDYTKPHLVSIKYKTQRTYHADEIAWYQNNFDDVVVSEHLDENKRKYWAIKIPNPVKGDNTYSDDLIIEGVDYVFEQNPELSKIGTQGQYSSYIDTVFPKSINSEIQTLSTTLNLFKDGGVLNLIRKGNRIKEQETYLEVVIGTKEYKGYEGSTTRNYKAIVDVKEEFYRQTSEGEYTYFKIKKPSQILILGSPQDISGFKEYVSNEKVYSDDLEMTERDKKMIESNQMMLTGYDYIDKYVMRWGYEILRLRNNITPANKVKTEAKIFKITERLKELIANPENNIPIIIRTAKEQLAQVKNLIDTFNSEEVKGHENEFYSASMEYLMGWQDISNIFQTVDEYKNDEEKMKEFDLIQIQAQRYQQQLQDLYQEYIVSVFNEGNSSATMEELFSPQVKTNMLESQLLDISTSKLPVLRKLYTYVNRAILSSRLDAGMKSEEIEVEIEKLMLWAERAGKSKKEVWDYFKQTDDKGKATGRYVTKYSIEYYRAFKAAKDKNLFLLENADWVINEAKWKEAQEIMKKEWGEDSQMYWTWFNDNSPHGQASGGAAYGEWVPKDKWIDSRYTTIQKTKELKEFYDYFTEVIEERSAILPVKPKEGMLPEMKAGFLLDMAKYGTKDFYKGLGPAMLDAFKVKSEGVLDKRDRDVESNLPRKNIPVYMMGNTMKADEKSYDLGAVLKSFSAMSYLYEYRAKVEENVLITRDMFKKALEQQEVPGQDIQKKGIFGELLSKAGIGKNKAALAALEYYVDVMIYDVRKEPILITKPNEKGESWSFDKFVGFWNKITRLRGLSLNPFSATTNLFFGVASNLTHAAGSEDFTRADAFWALGKMLGSLSQPNEYKKIEMMLNRFELPRDYSDQTAIGSILSEKVEKGLMFLQTKTEMFNQGQLVLAKLNNIKVDTKAGKVSLFECYKVVKKNGKDRLVWDTEKYGEEQYGLTTDEGFALYENMQQLSKNLHGNYDPSSPIKMKSNDYGQALMVFRSWIPQTFMNRFGSERQDERLGRTFKGRYRSFGAQYKASGNWGKFLLDLSGQVISMHTLGLIKNNSTSKMEKDVDIANMKKNVQEMIFVLDLYLLGLILTGFEPDKKDKKWRTAYNFTLLQIMRTKQDMTFFVSPESQSSIVQNVSPTVKTITDAMAIPGAVYKLMIGDDEIKAGYNKDRSNLGRTVMKFLPATAPIQRMFELGDISDVTTAKR